MDWIDPSDTSFSREFGGRWNPPGEFGALYLNATLALAAAQARHMYAGRAIKLFDLKPDDRPQLLEFLVPDCEVLDAVAGSAIALLGLPASYPYNVPWEPCQAIGRRAHGHGLAGVACRSNAESTPTSWIGEELALFDSQPLPGPHGKRRAFAEWYPDPIPD